MIRVDLNLEDREDLAAAGARWRFAPGLVPGEANEGLSARLAESPARLPDYDDSGWDTCDDIQQTVSSGFTFGWYRIAVTIPDRVHSVEVKGSRLYFETCIDDYGEVWIDGECDRQRGTVAGFNIPQRVLISLDVQPGARYVIACLAVNGPLAQPGGGIFMRYARLAFER